MGLHFGNLYKIYGITYYRVSRHELKPFAGFFSKGIQNWLRNLGNMALPIGIPFAFHYSAYTWINEEYYRINRKNPDDYKDDE